jgi:hypothetical protein
MMLLQLTENDGVVAVYTVFAKRGFREAVRLFC